MTIKSRKFEKGIRIKGTVDAATLDGEIRNDSASKRTKVYHDTDGTDAAGEREVLTEDQTQTVTNKTHISPIINTGVSGTAIDTDITLAADSDTKLASQKAVKAYVASQVATKDEASEVSYSQGANTRVVGADVQAALDSIEPELVSVVGSAQANATAISDHLTDAVDAHDASAVSNVPSGNLAATDVQTALNELQSDVDTNATNIGTNSTGISDHLADVIDAHDATAVSYTNVGSTLVATEVEAAIDALDVKVVNNNSILSGHINDNTGVHGVGEVVGTTEVQAISGKDIDGTVASNTSRVTLPKSDKATLDALTRKQGTLVYDTDTDNVYKDDGTNLIEIGGSGGSSGFNYIKNGKAEFNADDWTLYANTVAGIRPDNFGGSSAGMTFTRETASPLVNKAHFKLSKDAANRQGQGVYTPFSNETAHSTLKMLLSMFVDSSHANLSDADLAIYLVASSDSFVADFQVIEPNNPDMLAGVKQIQKQIQFLASDLDYRLCVHVKSTNATAYDLLIDEVEFGPKSAASGYVGTDPELYSEAPVTQGLGTVVTDGIVHWREGKYLNVEGRFRVGTVSALVARFGLPDGLSISNDSTKIYSGEVIRNNGSRITVLGVNGNNYVTFGGGAASQGDVVGSSLFGASEILFISFKVEIQGWSSNARMSEDLGARDVVVEGAGNGGTLITSGNVIDFTETRDTTSSFDGTTFIIPESGDYQFTGAVAHTTTIGGSVQLYINGIADKFIGMSTDQNNSRKIINYAGSFIKGQVVTIRCNSDLTLLNNSQVHFIHIQKLASSQTMLESETVALSVKTSAGQSIANNTVTTVVFGEVVTDSMGGFDPLTGIYTVRNSGYYIVSSRLGLNGKVTSDVARCFSQVAINGISDLQHGIDSGTAGGYTLFGLVGTSLHSLNKGDTIELEVSHNTGSSETLHTNGATNHMSIYRLK